MEIIVWLLCGFQPTLKSKSFLNLELQFLRELFDITLKGQLQGHTAIFKDLEMTLRTKIL